MKQKTFKNRSKFRNFLLFSFLLLLGGNLQAQPPLKAGFINSFVLPGQKDTINVIKKSELGTCTSSSIVVTVLNTTAAPGTQARGTAALSTDGNKNIIYTPNAGFVGQDSVKYTITCGVNVSNTGLILINVTDKPDVIKDEACAVTPPSFVWGMQELARSTEDVSVYVTPLAGDVDNDGNVEIISRPSDVGSLANNHLYVFQYDETRIGAGLNPLYVKYTIAHPTISTQSGEPYVLANVDGDGYSSIFLTSQTTSLSGAADARYLIKYKFNGTAFVEAWRRQYSTTDSWAGGPPLVADFMGTGNAQVAVYDKIWNAKDGTLLVDGGFLGQAGYNFGQISHSGGGSGSNTTDRPALASWVAADIDNDGILEIVAGNCVYKVNIANPNAQVAGNTYTKITTAAAGIENGTVSVADVDLDGYLDVVTTFRNAATTTGGAIAIYDPRTGALKSNIISGLKVQGTVVGGGGPSVPFLGDLNSSGKPFITFLEANNIRAYSYDPATQQFVPFWQLAVNDPSAGTTLSLFDFNQDGLAELVYRDERNIRIINGSLKSHITGNDTIVYNLAVEGPVGSGTVNEYPIVVDVNNDGQAEIVTAGATTNGGSVGPLRIYATNDPNSPWAPARTVWNSFYYNPVYINEDLTVVQHPLNPATKFVDKDGNYLRPFNNFLQQATLLNGEGKMLSYGSDLAFDLNVPIIYSNYTGSTVDVTFNIENTGDADFSGTLDISAYVLQAGNFTKVQTYVLNITIPIGTSLPVSYTITGLPAGIDPANIMQIRINESDDNFLVPECNYAGNFSKALFGAPDYGLCPGTHTLYFYPQNTSYVYVWYDSDPTQTPKPASIEVGDSHDFTQLATSLTKKFFVEVYDGPSLMDVYPVVTYLVPDSLVWTGTTSADWNDYRNWNYPNNPQPAITAYDTVKYQIPAECTNVLIPASALVYPNLSVFSSEIHPAAICNNIHFAFGGEVARTDTLLYNQAFVDLTLNTHQYYMIAPSLKNMYTGDYYITQPNPWLDDRLYEPMFFNVPNPQTLKTAVTTWTGRFNNPDILLNAGQGMAIWYNKLDQGYTYHNPVTTHFPKTDTQYRYYSEETQAPTLWGSYMDRNESHRFIYEPLATNGLVPLSLGNQTISADGTPALIGNPFMAHLNLDPFLTANSTEIYAGYKLASGVASVDGKMNNFVSYQRVGETWFTTDPNLSGAVVNLTSAPTIAPMQSFIVIAKKANPQIKAPVTTMTT
ncbi:MAG: hypothetical protein LBN18_03610, partial [Dysgonamonadaceae bacterium]|nr:hypothetical protein [Dysgonamonadaceae bacterium]